MSKINSIYSNESDAINPIWFNIFLFILAIAAPWLDTTVSNHEFVKSYIASFGVTLLLLLSLYFKCDNSPIQLKINPIKLLLLLLLGFGTISAFWSVNLDLTTTKWLLWLNVALSFILAVNFTNNHDNLLKLVWGLIIAAGAISIIGILQHLFDPFALAQAASPASTFGNKNMAAQPLVLILPLFVFLLLSNQVQNLKVWGLTTLTSLIFVYIAYSTTRAIWLSVSVELVLILGYLVVNRAKIGQWADWSNNKRNASIFGLVITLILVNLSASGFSNFLSTASGEFGSIVDSANDTNSVRYGIWQSALNMINDSPLLGSGLGSYAHNLSNEGYATWNLGHGIKRVHNDLLELAVELGLVGVTLFAGVVITILAGIIKILQRTKGESQHFYYLLFVALSGSFVNMQFSFPYQMAVPLMLFGLYVGLIAKQSDALIKPIGVLTLPCNTLQKKTVLTISFSLIVILFYYSYFYWIGIYSQLNKIKTTGDFQKISIVDAPIHHGTIYSTLNLLGIAYFQKELYKQSYIIDKQLSELWPNHEDSLTRLGFASHKLNNNKKALELALRLTKIESEGLYNAYFLKMHVYSSTGDKEKFLKTFHELLSQPEEFLKLSDQTYHTLLGFAPMYDELSHFAPMLYKKYIEHHGYSCLVENNIAVYYFNDGQFEKSAEHIKLAIDDESKCVNQQLVQVLKNGGVL